MKNPLQLPSSTIVDRPLPKTQLYKKFELKQSQRDAVDADIVRLDFVNMIAPQTMPAIAEGTDVKAVFVVEVELKRPDYDKKSIALVAKLIPQQIIFALRYGEKVQLAAYHTKLFVGQWQPMETVSIPLAGLNLDAVWQNMVAAIGEMEVADGNTLTEQIQADDERTKLLKRIETLERQMRSTTQKHRQRELYAEIKKIKEVL